MGFHAAFFPSLFSLGRNRLPTPVFLGFPGGSDGKESSCNMGDLGSIPGLGRSTRGEHGNTLQYSCLENPHDRGAWQATVYGVTELDMTEQLSTQKPFQIFKNLFLIGG